jgi:hypothetical protein
VVNDEVRALACGVDLGRRTDQKGAGALAALLFSTSVPRSGEWPPIASSK